MRRVRLSKLGPAERSRLTRRSVIPDLSIRRQAAEIVEAIRIGGDRALIDAGLRYGGGLAGGSFEITAVEGERALARIDPATKQALEAAADAIRRTHLRQLPADDSFDPAPGVRVERRWAPLRRVGVYVPGGGAAYPSTLLMGVIPARIAGVQSIVVASPADNDGAVDDVVLAAAALAGVDRFLVMGGAQAIGALAYGTESIEPVEKIVGPGNAWVTAAKLAVLGDCAIDLPAGPSEALVIADAGADPLLVAVDLICQAEHGPDSPVVLVTTDASLADRVVVEMTGQLERLSRRAILDKALTDHGLIVEADDLEVAIDFAQNFAAEHVSIHTNDAGAVASRITAAGSVYVGTFAPESAGDYATGANHILPTGGQARAAGPLAIEDFGSWRQVQYLTRAGLEALRPTIVTLARAEGLDAHALAAEVRFPDASSQTGGSS